MGKKGGGQPSFTQTTSLTKSQQEVSKTLGSFYNSILPSQVGQGIKAYKKGNVLPVTSQFTNATNNLTGMDATGGFLGQQSNIALQPGLTAAESFQGVNAAQSGGAGNYLNDQAVQDYYQKSVAAPSMQNYQQNIAPQIDSGFSGFGGIFNSRRGYDQSQALSNMNVANNAQLAATSLQQQQLRAQLGQQNDQYNAGQQNQVGEFNVSAQQSALNQQLQASQQAQNNLNSQFNRAGTQATAAGAYQQNQNLSSQAGYNEYLRTQPYNNPYVAAASSYMQAPLATTVPYQQQSLASQIGQGLGTIGSIPLALGGIGAAGSAIGGLLGLGGAGALGGAALGSVGAGLAGAGATAAGSLGAASGLLGALPFLPLI